MGVTSRAPVGEIGGPVIERREQGGWCDPAALPRGPGGRALCRQCGTEVPVSRRTFCGRKCVETWKLRTDPGAMREFCWNRDGGICQLCGLDIGKLVARFGRVARKLAERQHQRATAALQARSRRVSGLWLTWIGRRVAWYSLYQRAAVPQAWDMDHIIPLCEGGTNQTLNLRVLCRPCHRRVTRELAGRRAAQRRLATKGEVTL